MATTSSSYAADLYKQLGVGPKKDDRGVLLLVAPNDRRYRVEVGYGLEPVINDARAGDAGRLMAPYFRQGDYSSGITAGAWQLAKYVADDKGVTLTGAPQLRPVRQEKDTGSLGIWIFLGIILLVFLLSRSGGSGSNINRRGGGMGSGWWIGPMMGGGWGGSRGGWGGSGGGGLGRRRWRLRRIWWRIERRGRGKRRLVSEIHGVVWVRLWKRSSKNWSVD